jgi:hypothetical protein
MANLLSGETGYIDGGDKEEGFAVHFGNLWQGAGLNNQ